jgi:hypothetical protein
MNKENFFRIVKLSSFLERLSDKKIDTWFTDSSANVMISREEDDPLHPSMIALVGTFTFFEK